MKGLFTFAVVFALNLYTASSDFLDNWHLRSGHGTNGPPLESVTYGFGKFVAVGPTGRIVASIDGSHWTDVPSPTTNDLVKVRIVNGQLVATGANGTVLWSSNGVDWVNQPIPTTATITGVAQGNDQFMAVALGSSFTSTNAIDWTVLPNSGAGDVVFGNGIFVTAASSIAFGAGRFVIPSFDFVGEWDVLSLWTSVDGTNWTRTGPSGWPDRTLARITYGDGGFLLPHRLGLLVSSTGTNWLTRRLPYYPKEVVRHGSVAVLVGSQGPMQSFDLGNWSLPGTPTTNRLYGAAYGNGVFVVSGQSGVTLVSSNALDWTGLDMAAFFDYSAGSQDFDQLFGCYGMLFYQPGFIAGIQASHTSGFLRSADGISWTHITGPSAVRDIQFLNDKLIAGAAIPRVAFSDNGLIWSNSLDGAGAAAVTGIAYGNGSYLAAYQYGSLTSRDLRAWTSSQESLRGVVFAKGAFFGIREGGVIRRSSDGQGWTSLASGPTNALNHIVSYHGNLVAVGANGTIITSSDGVTWITRDSGVLDNLNRAASANGTLLVVGDGGVILQSDPDVAISQAPSDTDAVVGDAVSFRLEADPPGATFQWFKDGVPISGATNAVIAFPAVEPSDAGHYTVLASIPGASITSVAGRLAVYSSRLALKLDELPELTIRGIVSRTYRIEVAPSPLGPWTPQTNIFLKTTYATLQDHFVPDEPNRFYRAVLLPPE